MNEIRYDLLSAISEADFKCRCENGCRNATDCGCIFVASNADFEHDSYGKWATCPQEGCERNFIVRPDDGEPYEEPTQNKSPERKAPGMDVDIIKAAAFILYFKDCFFKNDDDPCVTFREG